MRNKKCAALELSEPSEDLFCNLYISIERSTDYVGSRTNRYHKLQIPEAWSKLFCATSFTKNKLRSRIDCNTTIHTTPATPTTKHIVNSNIIIF